MKRLLLRKHEAARCAMKHSLRLHEAKRGLLFREPKARFTERSSASLFMRVSALHFQNKTHFLRSAFCFGGDIRI